MDSNGRRAEHVSEDLFPVCRAESAPTDPELTRWEVERDQAVGECGWRQYSRNEWQPVRDDCVEVVELRSSDAKASDVSGRSFDVADRTTDTNRVARSDLKPELQCPAWTDKHHH